MNDQVYSRIRTAAKPNLSQLLSTIKAWGQVSRSSALKRSSASSLSPVPESEGGEAASLKTSRPASAKGAVNMISSRDKI